jgi:leucyl aminopeptidase
VTLPQLSLVSSAPADSVLVVGARTIKKNYEIVSGEDHSRLVSIATTLEISGAMDTLTKITDPENSQRVIAFAGLGSEPVTPALLRNVAASAVRKLQGAGHVALDFNVSTAAEVLAVAEGALLGAYTFDSYKSTPPTQAPVASVTVVTPLSDTGIIERALIVR